MVDANLLVTYDPNHIGLAKEEITSILKKIGITPNFLDLKVDGLFRINIEEPKKAVKKLSEICKKDSSDFSITFHWIPVDNWTKSTIEDMQHVIKGLVDHISEKERWKMDIAKRCYDKYSTTELIMKLTEIVDKPNVDLNNPDKIIRVDIIGDEAGISVLEKNEILNTTSVSK
ncbi:MAG: THUMP domain-containing protein [Candidatus Nanoarchaeia archaeon]|nr:THUMP domain-containing protein [Candidatus Nanoarchaeia archaeon]